MSKRGPRRPRPRPRNYMVFVTALRGWLRLEPLPPEAQHV